MRVTRSWCMKIFPSERAFPMNGIETVVCFALKHEAGPFQRLAASRPGVSVLIVGIGRRNAESSLRRFLEENSPLLVLTCGFAGGLRPDLKVGEVIFEPGDGPAAPSASCRDKLAGAGARPARFLGVDHMVTTAAEKQKLREATGADAVEMESAAIHGVCRARGIACVTVRAISDAAAEDLPLDFNMLAKADQSLDYRKLAWAIVKAPGKIGALRGLQKKTRLAAQRLAEVLGRVL